MLNLNSYWIEKSPNYLYQQGEVYEKQPRIYKQIRYSNNGGLRDVDENTNEYERIAVGRKEYQQGDQKEFRKQVDPEKVQELRRIYQDYKKESLRESIANIRSTLNIATEDDILKQKTHCKVFNRQ